MILTHTGLQVVEDFSHVDAHNPKNTKKRIFMAFALLLGYGIMTLLAEWA